MKTKKGSIESSILEVWKNAAEQTEAEKLHRPSYEVGTDEYADYTKNLTPGQEVTQKLDEKGLPPWLDKNKKKDDDDDDDKKSSKKGNLPPWLKGKGKDKKEALSAKQKKLDVDGDGDIEGDDLADLRNKKKKSESNRARETWKEAIKKVAEYSKDKQEEEDEVKCKKTMTGGKKVDVAINPDLEKEEHKKKKMNAGYSY